MTVPVAVQGFETLPLRGGDAAASSHEIGDRCLRRRVPLQRHVVAVWEQRAAAKKLARVTKSRLAAAL